MTNLDIRLVQKRVANIAIGASTLRNQGKGTTSVAIKFISGLDLKKFKGITKKEFMILIDELTEELMGKFPFGSENNWGAARKSINVFLEEVFYNRFLVRECRLQNLEKYLEIPLDSNVIKKLQENDSAGILPRWGGIKYLKPEDSKQYQDFAKKLAIGKETARIYLDLEFWRSES